MSTAVEDTELEVLVAENQSIIARFDLSEGMINQPANFEFVCEFDDVEQARSFRTDLKSENSKQQETQGWSGEVWMVCDYSGHAQPSEMRFDVSMPIDPRVISMVELTCRRVGQPYDILDVAWEFDRPDAKTARRVH
ncbi:MAG: hypothetical protein ACSHWS_14675 [Sulfitobacter sp.]